MADAEMGTVPEGHRLIEAFNLKGAIEYAMNTEAAREALSDMPPARRRSWTRSLCTTRP